MIKDILADARERMEKTIDALQNDLRAIRTGRASPALVERLMVEYYGVPTPLIQLAGVTVPEPRMLMIRPWDRNTISTIEKAILKSDLGLNPSNDGRLIRVVIPYLSEERRKELIKVTHKKVEEGRVAVRACRHEAMADMEKLQKAKQISEDDFKRGKDRLQKTTDAHIAKVEQVGANKEQEILEV